MRSEVVLPCGTESANAFPDHDRTWFLELWLIDDGGGTNHFEGSVVVRDRVANSPKLYITPTENMVYRDDPNGMDALTAVLHGTFAYPAWLVQTSPKHGRYIRVTDQTTGADAKYLTKEQLPPANVLDKDSL